MTTEMSNSGALPRSPVRQNTIDRARIIAAAIELLDEGGITHLSTRKLAERLGVRSPTLYWHIRNKAELLDLVAESLCAEAFDIDASAPWRTQLEQGMSQFRNLVRSHRDVAVLLRERPATGPNRLGHIDTTLRIMLEAGLTPEDAARFSRLLVALVLAPPPVTEPFGAGSAAAQESLGNYPSLQRVSPALAHVSKDDLFDLGVRVILDGIERCIDVPSTPPCGSPSS